MECESTNDVDEIDVMLMEYRYYDIGKPIVSENIRNCSNLDQKIDEVI